MSMNRPDYFIVTSDPLTASQLHSLGFQVCSESNGITMFLNCKNIVFSDQVDISKISYTDKMFV